VPLAVPPGRTGVNVQVRAAHQFKELVPEGRLGRPARGAPRPPP
jgi:hypothetical protein